MIIISDFEKLRKVFPNYMKEVFQNSTERSRFIEIVLDLGRRPEGRSIGSSEYLSERLVSWQDLDYTVKRLGKFSDDNRAGIERTLHRISCIRNRQNIIIGLTCRIGRCILGNISIIRDILDSNASLLLLGKPGTGKTTLIREMSRILSDEMNKRVVIVDTANEIAGESDIPHAGIGRARRMQVSHSEEQHSVMIEAVENHMPEVIVVDEIGTELEALAARTIAERGVQLIGTVHGNVLENLMKNPTLSDLIGGIQNVTLSDEEAKRRGRQKTVLERKSFSTFQIAIELNNTNHWTVHPNVEQSVDLLLQGNHPKVETRSFNTEGLLKIDSTYLLSIETSFVKTFDSKTPFVPFFTSKTWSFPLKKKRVLKRKKWNTDFLAHVTKRKEINIYSYHVSVDKLQKLLGSLQIAFCMTKRVETADLIFLSKAYVQSSTPWTQMIKKKKIPTFFVPNHYPID